MKIVVKIKISLEIGINQTKIFLNWEKMFYWCMQIKNRTNYAKKYFMTHDFYYKIPVSWSSEVGTQQKNVCKTFAFIKLN